MTVSQRSPLAYTSQSTHHKPLVPLLGSHPLDNLPARFLRFRLRLLRYHFNIVHVSGKDLTIADALSRAPAPSITANPDDAILNDNAEAMLITAVDAIPASSEYLDEILSWQESDPVCEQLVQLITKGWPHSSTVPPDIQSYVSHRSNLTLSSDGLLLFNNRVLVPLIIKMSSKGCTLNTKTSPSVDDWPRCLFGGPAHDAAIEHFVQVCGECAVSRFQPAEPPVPSPYLPYHGSVLPLTFFTWILVIFFL